MRFFHRLSGSTLSISRCNILSHSPSMPWPPSFLNLFHLHRFQQFHQKTEKGIGRNLLVDLKASQGLEKNISGKVLVKSNIDLNQLHINVLCKPVSFLFQLKTPTVQPFFQIHKRALKLDIMLNFDILSIDDLDTYKLIGGPSSFIMKVSLWDVSRLSKHIFIFPLTWKYL